MSIVTHPVRKTALLIALIVLTTASAAAQGRRGDRGGLLSMLRRDEVRQALGLTPEQIVKVDELRAKARLGEEFYAGYQKRVFDAATEEDRKPIRDEMAAAEAATRQAGEDGAKQLLTAEQATKLTQWIVSERRTSALDEPLVREQLGMTPEQADRLAKLAEERQEQAQGLPFGSDPQRFEKFQQEWAAKPLTVLTAEQKAKWDAAAAAGAAAIAEQQARAETVAGSDDRREERTSAAAQTAQAEESPPNSADAAPAADVAANSDAPVVSFGAGEARPTSDLSDERVLSFNFRYAPWPEVLRHFADLANLTLDLDATPTGTFNYYDARKYTPTEALDVLNGYLLQKGYILVRRDNFLVCLNIDEGIPPNLVPNITADELGKRGQNELLNVVFPIAGADPVNVAKEVELLLGPQGKVVPLSTSKSLAVTDIGSNLRRIDRLLSSVSAAALGDLTFKSYPLRHLDPADAEGIVKNQLGLSTGVQNVSSSSSAYDQYRRDRDSRDRGDDRRTPTPAAPATTTRVAADARTGSLLITATAAQHRIVEEVLKVTDVPAEGGGGRRDNEPYLKVYGLRNSDAQEVVKTLDVLMPGIVVNEDGRNRKIHILAPEAVHREVELLLRQFDGEGTTMSAAVTVIPLANTDPYNAAATIRSLFAGDGDDAPVVEADTYGRRLMVRGTADQVAQVKALLAQLGEDGTGSANRNGSGPVRTISLGGRDPDELIPLLQRLWDASGDAPLRVVPTGPGRIIERRQLGRPPAPILEESREPAPAANFNVVDPAGESRVESPESRDRDEGQAPEGEATDAAAEPADAEPADAEPADATEEPADAEPAKSDAPVAVTVQGGNLVLSSEDEESLNRLEDLVDRLGQVIPPRTKWTVFYLRTADATETAMLLEQLFPTSSVSATSLDGGIFSSLTSGLSSFGSSVVDAAGLDTLGLDTQTMRIIPDVRSNSLFVSGPPDKIAELEQVLNVLDETDLPDSLRARVPRLIEVKHADVDDVAKIVREIYKDYLQPANMVGGANPLAMLLGGGGGGGGRGRDDNKDPGQIRLTVDVDTATGHLVVSASEELFQQVKQLVEKLDEEALRANRTVRVVTLQNADAAMVQNTLGSLIPKVRTSSTSDRRSGAAGQSSGSNAPPTPSSGQQGGGGNSDQERIQRMFEDRIRERMREQMGGGDSGSRSGRSSSFGGGSRGGSGR